MSTSLTRSSSVSSSSSSSSSSDLSPHPRARSSTVDSIHSTRMPHQRHRDQRHKADSTGAAIGTRGTPGTDGGGGTSSTRTTKTRTETLGEDHNINNIRCAPKLPPPPHGADLLHPESTPAHPPPAPIGLVSHCLSHSCQLISSSLPLPSICISDLDISWEDGQSPYQRVVVPHLLAMNDEQDDAGAGVAVGGGASLSSTIYAHYKNQHVILLKLSPLTSGSGSSSDSDLAIQTLSNEVNIMSSIPSSMSHSVVHILGQTLFKSAIYIVFEWIDEGVIHQYLKQFEAAQSHRIVRFKHTMQAIGILKELYRNAMSDAASSGSATSGDKNEFLSPISSASASTSSSSSSISATAATTTTYSSSSSSGCTSMSPALSFPPPHSQMNHAPSPSPSPSSSDLSFLSIPPDEITYILDSHSHGRSSSVGNAGERDTRSKKLLGRGTYASVYLGKYRGRFVAIKETHKQGNGKEESAMMNLFQKEVQLMYEVRSSPHIVHLEGICRKDGVDMIVMEYLPSNLFHYLQEHDSAQITWTQRIKWMRQLSSGLQLLHSKGIVHRDSKSSNFLLDSKLNLKLIDLGLSHHIDDRNAPKAAGSPVYMAHEQFAPSSSSSSSSSSLSEACQASCNIFSYHSHNNNNTNNRTRSRSFLLSRIFDKRREEKKYGAQTKTTTAGENAHLSPPLASSSSTSSSSPSRTNSSPYFSMDIWSFGQNCIEIITGQRPFWKIQTNVQQEVIKFLRDLTSHEQLKSQLPSFPESCPLELYELILECLQIDPRQRPNMRSVNEKLCRIDLKRTQSIAQWRMMLSKQTSLLQSIDSFNHARTMIGFYSIYMTDEESRSFEADLIEIESIREWLQAEYRNPAFTQATHSDQILIGESDLHDGDEPEHMSQHPSQQSSRRPSFLSDPIPPSVKSAVSSDAIALHLLDVPDSFSTQRQHVKKLSRHYCSSQLPPEALKQYEHLFTCANGSAKAASASVSTGSSAWENLKIEGKLTMSKSAQNISSLRT